MRQWLNTIDTMTLIAMAQKLGIVFRGAMPDQRQMSINYLWQLSMIYNITIAQYQAFYQRLNETATTYFVEV